MPARYKARFEQPVDAPERQVLRTYLGLSPGPNLKNTRRLSAILDCYCATFLQPKIVIVTDYLDRHNRNGPFEEDMQIRHVVREVISQFIKERITWYFWEDLLEEPGAQEKIRIHSLLYENDGRYRESIDSDRDLYLGRKFGDEALTQEVTRTSTEYLIEEIAVCAHLIRSRGLEAQCYPGTILNSFRALSSTLSDLDPDLAHQRYYQISLKKRG